MNGLQTEINGLKINYIDEGTGAPVLFLHGWGSSILPFTNLINTLKPSHRVVALDFPGCGESETMKTPWTIDDYCNFVLEFIEKVGLDNPTLIGHSHGGRVILKLLGEKRLNPKKVVLLDSAGLIPKKSIKQKIRAKSFKLVKSVLKLPFFNKNREKLLNKARKKYGSADYNAAPEVLRKTLVNVVNVDLRHLLGNIESSVLLIWGEKDTATPLSDAKTIEAGIKDCGLCVIKDGGHFAFLDNPYQSSAILKSFLG